MPSYFIVFWLLQVAPLINILLTIEVGFVFQLHVFSYFVYYCLSNLNNNLARKSQILK